MHAGFWDNFFFFFFFFWGRPSSKKFHFHHFWYKQNLTLALSLIGAPNSKSLSTIGPLFSPAANIRGVIPVSCKKRTCVWIKQTYLTCIKKNWIQTIWVKTLYKWQIIFTTKHLMYYQRSKSAKTFTLGPFWPLVLQNCGPLNIFSASIFFPIIF